MKAQLTFKTYTQANKENKAVTIDTVEVMVAGDINPSLQINVTGKAILNELLLNNQEASVRFVSMTITEDITITEATPSQITPDEQKELSDNYDKAVMQILEGNLQAIKQDANTIRYQDITFTHEEERAKEKLEDIKEWAGNIKNLITQYMEATRKRGL